MNKCFWGHDWSKWETYTVNHKATDGTTPFISAIEKRQYRECRRCGKTQDERVSLIQ